MLLFDVRGDVLTVNMVTLFAHPLLGTVLILLIPKDSGSFCYSSLLFSLICLCCTRLSLRTSHHISINFFSPGSSRARPDQ